MLHTGGGWGVTPHMIVKRFGCMAIHNKALYKCIIHSFIHSRSILVASKNYGWTTDVSWTILTMSLLPFWALNVIDPLLSMQGHEALRFHQKYLNLCSEDERRSYGFGMTWGWVINDRIFIFGWTIYLKSQVANGLHICPKCLGFVLVFLLFSFLLKVMTEK